ncbi:MAG: penicillin-binding protein 2 [Holophagales bacterium]|nr:penicillin-binding protein 2 [Holophagales bacterium]
MEQRNRMLLQRRLGVFEGALWCLLGIVTVRYGWIQILRGKELKQDAIMQAIKIQTTPAPRGLVLDRNGHKLIENQYALNLVIDRGDLPDLPKDRPQNVRQTSAVQQVQALAHELQMEPDDLRRKILAANQAGSNRYLLLKDNLDESDLAEAEKTRARFPFVSIKVAPRRIYMGEELAGHVLGYVGEVSKEKLAQLKDKNYRQGDIIGIDGLESSHDDILRGKDGSREIIADYLGREVALKGENPYKVGETVYLTLDAGLQSILHNAYGEENGAAVVLDLRDGGVLAMYSSASFDPNAFLDRRNTKKTEYLLDSDGRNRMYNRAIKSTHSPGSTFKLLMALSALEHGVITPQTRITCTGTKSFYNAPRRCEGTHGSIDLLQAITVSCNIFFFELGTRLDIDQIYETALKYGLAEKTGVDLPNEIPSRIPNRAWKERQFSDPAQKKWYSGDTVTAAVGQGAVGVTVIGLARFFSTLALKGKIITPHLLLGYRDEQTQKLKEYPPKPVRDTNLDNNTWTLLDQAMSQVVRYGTARSIYMPDLEICGKTGTAQVAKFTTREAYLSSAKQFRDHAWFAGYAPRDNPQIAWAILVEHAGFGASAAAPIAQKICKYWFIERKTNPLPPPVKRPSGSFYAIPNEIDRDKQ